jgi:hypothetical protein
MPKHGFSAALLGRLTFNRGRGGSRGAFCALRAALPGGLGTIVRIGDQGGRRVDDPDGYASDSQNTNAQCGALAMVCWGSAAAS